jgi:lipoprotein-releasing system permease protein
MIPVGGASGTELRPRIQRFTVSGIFEVGLQDHDSLLALVHLSDAQALRGSAGVSGLRLRFADVFAAPQLAAGTAVALGGKFRVRDWTQENASYFRAIRIEKTMMTLILLLIVAVAAFNIVATLVMVVTDKRTDIAILRTIGARPGSVPRSVSWPGSPSRSTSQRWLRSSSALSGSSSWIAMSTTSRRFLRTSRRSTWCSSAWSPSS